MTVSLWKASLVLLVVRQSIVAVVNRILETYPKGAVGKKGDKILAGSVGFTYEFETMFLKHFWR